MSERYLVTGAQLGMFQAFADSEQPHKIKELIEEIIDKQFLGNSRRPVTEMVKQLSNTPILWKD